MNAQPDAIDMHGEHLPIYSGGIYVPPGSTIELSGEVEVGNLVNAGTVKVHDGATVTFSNIQNIPGSEFGNADPAEPIDCEFRHRPVPYQDNDPTKRGNSFIVAGGRINLYGKPVLHPVTLSPGAPVPSTWHRKDHVEEHDGCRVNFGRSIKFTRVDESHPIRPHFMVMGGAEARLRSVEWSGYGLSKKSIPLHSTKNPRAAYACHIHVNGEDIVILVEDCSSHGSPGIAFSNHSSNVVFRRCVGSAHGCAFFIEAGDELGLLQDCVDINCLSDTESVSRQTNDANGAFGDFGIGGEGIWCQSQRVRVVNHTSINAGVGAFFFFRGLAEVADGTLLPDGSFSGKSKRFADGTRVDRNNPPAVEGLTIINPRNFGLRSRWANAPRRIDGLSITGAKRIGIHAEYDGGMIVEDGVVEGTGTAGIFTRDQHYQTAQPIPVEYKFRRCRIAGFDAGYADSRYTTAHPLILDECEVQANVVGMRVYPSQMLHGNKRLHVDCTTIDAPVDVELVEPPANNPAPFKASPNEFWRDGVRLPWPGVD